MRKVLLLFVLVVTASAFALSVIVSEQWFNDYDTAVLDTLGGVDTAISSIRDVSMGRHYNYDVAVFIDTLLEAGYTYNDTLDTVVVVLQNRKQVNGLTGAWSTLLADTVSDSVVTWAEHAFTTDTMSIGREFRTLLIHWGSYLVALGADTNYIYVGSKLTSKL